MSAWVVVLPSKFKNVASLLPLKCQVGKSICLPVWSVFIAWSKCVTLGGTAVGNPTSVVIATASKSPTQFTLTGLYRLRPLDSLHTKHASFIVLATKAAIIAPRLQPDRLIVK